MLEITNLHATVADKPIFKGLTLAVPTCKAQKRLAIDLEGSVG